jgi:hypothetical protein
MHPGVIAYYELPLFNVSHSVNRTAYQQQDPGNEEMHVQIRNT